MSKIKLNPLFTDQVVLQAEKECFLTGYVLANEVVEIQIGEVELKATADESGYFSACLPAQNYGTICEIVITTASEQKKVKSQYGDVFLFGGQSNMEYKMANESHFQAVKEKLRKKVSTIFFLNVPQIEYEDETEKIPETEMWQTWRQIDEDSLSDVSAVAYYTISQYQEKYPDRILGIVNCSKGGTSASAWISHDLLEQSEAIINDLLIPFEEEIKGKTKAQFETELVAYQAKAKSYYAMREKWQINHPELSLGQIKKEIGYSPWPPPASPYSFLRPAGLYQTMFRKIIPYTFKGVIWYQGEEDTQHAYLYEKLLLLLISQWRKDLQQALPFYIVQLPNCNDRPNHDWTGVRLAQVKVASDVANTYLITSLDCGLDDNIHPPEKAVLGRRIGEIMEQRYYASAPVAKLIVKEKAKWVIEIQNAQSLSVPEKGTIQCNFEDCGVKIQGNRIEIVAQNQEKLTFVGYALSNAPKALLFNEVGYPVAPFYFGK